MHLLVIEDERALCETIVRSLRRQAYSVDCCYDGEKALELLGVEHYDLVLLDLNLPGKDGMTVLRTLRQTDRETKVLILSARGEVEDKVEGLDAGANDYLAKPFHLAELEARIRSLTLRQFTQQDVLLVCGDLTFDTRSRTAAGARRTATGDEPPRRVRPAAAHAHAAADAVAHPDKRPHAAAAHRAAAVSARGKAGKAPARRSAREAYPSGKAISDGMGWRPCITGTSAAATAAIPASPSPIRPRTAHLRPRRGRIFRLRRLHRRGIHRRRGAHRRWICSTACSRGCTSAISTAAIC